MSPYLSCALGAVATVIFMSVLPEGRSSDLVVGMYIGFIIGVVTVCVIERAPYIEDRDG